MIDLSSVSELLCNISFKKNIEICNEVRYYVNIFRKLCNLSLILILLLFLGEVTSGKHTNKYTKGTKKSHRETRNDSIAR